MKEFLQQAVRVLALSVLAAGTFGVVMAWTGPSAVAPNSNTSAPINVSSTAQTKAGSITATNFCLSGSGACLTATTFGGAFELMSSGGCYIVNYVTGGCSCPSYAPYARQVGQADLNSTYSGARMYVCST